jgi:predicted  nucleic acid-binding Zn-ribbon protein
MRAEIDKLGREKKDMAERIREVENQLEWVRSEREEECGKLLSEKKGLQDRLRDTESQLAQLKSRKRDELKVVITDYLDYENSN